MRSVGVVMAGVASVVSMPSAERGYEELASLYERAGMADEAEAVRFLISEKFRAHDPDTDEGQRGDGR